MQGSHILVLFVAVLLAPIVIACPDNPDLDPDCRPRPEYYTVLYSEPDWGLYSAGDHVWMHATSSTEASFDAWYVIPASDNGFRGEAPSNVSPDPWPYGGFWDGCWTIQSNYSLSYWPWWW